MLMDLQLGPLFYRLASEGCRVRLNAYAAFTCASTDYGTRQNRHSALKVVKSAARYTETARDEIKLLTTVAEANREHEGRNHLCQFLDAFDHQGVGEEVHVCMVFEPLGETLLALIERNKKTNLPRNLVKVIAKQILLGLEYLADEVRFSSVSRITRKVTANTVRPGPYRYQTRKYPGLYS